MKMRLCPDFESIRDVLSVKNDYYNFEDRAMFALQGRRCENYTDSKIVCKSTHDISRLLSNLFFTFAYI